jgi:hypothetical protein
MSVTYTGRTCATTAGTCPPIAAAATALWAWRWTSGTWVPLGGATGIGDAEATVGRPLPVPQADFVGTGANLGQVRIRVQVTGAATNLVSAGNRLLITYDAP